MLVGVISDIHANRVALEAVLEDLPAVDALICAGDVIGYNPWPAACIDRLMDLDVPTVMGNHDRKLVTGSNFVGNRMARAGIEHARDQVSPEQRDWLADLPSERLLFDDRVQLVHGHPDDPDHYTYPEEFGAQLLDEAPVLVLGHTHIQGYEQTEAGIVVNPGSVGQPRDRDPRAAYALLDLEALSVQLHRVAYEIDTVREAVEAAGLPPRTGQRLVEGR
jgi:putative phosphoesterase